MKLPIKQLIQFIGINWNWLKTLIAKLVIDWQINLCNPLLENITGVTSKNSLIVKNQNYIFSPIGARYGSSCSKARCRNNPLRNHQSIRFKF
mgnify:CR=1 FL=1